MSMRAAVAALVVVGMLAACSAGPRLAAPLVRMPVMWMPAFFPRLTSCQEMDFNDPLWSPNGKLIYFMANTGVNGGDLYVMSNTGRGAGLLVSRVQTPTLSPDGWMMLLADIPYRGLSFPPLRVVNTRSSRVVHYIQNATNGSWSPDSRWIAFMGAGPADSGYAIYKTNVVTGQTIRLLDSTNTYPSILWSPWIGEAGGSQAIAYRSEQPGQNPAVWLMGADGTLITRLTGPDACPADTHPNGYRPVRWRPDGQALAIAHDCGPRTTLDVVSTAGVELADLSVLGSDIEDMDWSPDGKRILYAQQGSYGVHVADADGSHSILLAASADDPSWSPDGGLILFVGRDPARLEQIYTIRPDGTRRAQITRNPGLMCLN